jgi:protease secretion system membrane fusion protein
MNNRQPNPGSRRGIAKYIQNLGSKLTGLVNWLKCIVSRCASSYATWHELRTGKRDERFYSWLGWQVLIWGFGGSILWATFAPIEKGVSASGVVIVDSNRKTIQPAFSGIIDQVNVREGQEVHAGEVLIKLNPVNAQAQSNATREVVNGLDAQAEGLRKSIIQKKQQSHLFDQQIDSDRELVAEGYLARNKMLELERQQLQLKASILEDEGNLRHIEKQINEQQEKLNSYDYDLGNTEIKSPVDGSIVNLAVFTKGGVVSPGQRLMDVVPTNESLLVEANLPVYLIDKVHVGLPVEMRFTAFNRNRTPQIPGVLVAVDGDRIIDEKTGAPYYKIQAVSSSSGEKLLSDLQLRPGMSVEVFVKTGERSMMSYLLKPLFDRLHAAMREE